MSLKQNEKFVNIFFYNNYRSKCRKSKHYISQIIQNNKIVAIIELYIYIERIC